MTKEAESIRNQIKLLDVKLNDLYNEPVTVLTNLKITVLENQESYLERMICESCNGYGEVDKTPHCRSIEPVEEVCNKCGGTGVRESLDSVFYPYDIIESEG